jgi:molybdate transport system regulatory protein
MARGDGGPGVVRANTQLRRTLNMFLDERPAISLTYARYSPGETSTMAAPRLSIRIDLASGDRIGPGKIALLEAIRSNGSISAAARSLDMSYRRAWLLVEEINHSLLEPAVTAEIGGRRGGGAALTAVGERIIDLYRSIESHARSAAGGEFRAIGRLVRPERSTA